MPDPPGADAPPPEDLLGGNGASDSSLNTQTCEAVTGGTANPPAWSPEATQVQLDHEKLMKKTFQVLGIVPSSKSTRRLMVLMHDTSTPPSQAPALARAAQRAVRNDAALASNESTLRSAQDLGARSEPGADLGARSEPGAPAQDLGARSEPGT
ncbi:BZ3500_MvSof-1268-A1-R1_Chr2-1g04710 [Microbotryum saponariae]|uniref:BZ3500_MvSof-1268-A1-R1_Chr2-1g04710 protein n=1 Tax=Microbotryum saponariae TaxID=289078 RepID=A0A2X0MAR5_9BASI|nr:BZ3500_MvSof-1268-A1-R1_Chr2-1g04710 [Microbotryum saponariae]